MAAAVVLVPVLAGSVAHASTLSPEVVGDADVSGAAATSTLSADRAEGLWYFDAFHVGDAHAAGYTGEGVTVAVIDGSINPDLRVFEGADLTVVGPPCDLPGVDSTGTSSDFEFARHGTGVTALVIGTGVGEDGGESTLGVAPDATVLFYGVGTDVVGVETRGCLDEAGDPVSAYDLAIEAAVDAGADIISISRTFDGGQTGVARALHEGVIVLTALTNTGGDRVQAYSVELNGVVSVQAVDEFAAINTHDVDGVEVPNLDPRVDVAGPGVHILVPGSLSEGWSGGSLVDGTSAATPIVAGFLAVVAQKYPEATSNQLLQSLIHNTGGEDHPLTYDPSGAYGYGIASLTHMLRVDPTQYEDVNPFITDEDLPLPEEIAEAGDDQATAEPTAPPAGLSSPWVPWVIGLVVLVSAVGVAVLVVVLVRRRLRREGGTT